jgi:hypothetical protein
VTIIDEELGAITGRRHEFTRMFCMVSFKSNSKYIEPTLALIDTGAFISLLPQFIWKDIDVEFIGDYKVRGIVRRKECSIPVKVGNTKCRLTDRYGNISSPFDALIYCAYTSSYNHESKRYVR